MALIAGFFPAFGAKAFAVVIGGTLLLWLAVLLNKSISGPNPSKPRQ